MSSALHTEYAALHEEYSKKYGRKTAIFLMVGSFYELYDRILPNGLTVLNVKEISEFLGIQVSSKKNEEGEELIIAGFPDYVLHKWAGKLTAAGWTVVIVDQVKDKGGKVLERKVSRILSPSTHLEALSSYDAPTICGVWLSFPLYAAAAFDLSTGSTYTTNGQLRGTADSWTCDELLHFLSVFSPRELLVLHNTLSEDELRKQLDYVRPNTLLHVRPQSLGALELPAAREEYLRRLYAPKTILPTIEYLQLENVYEEKSLCATLRFIEDHFPSSFERLQPNQRWSPSHLLLLGNHALQQLQIIGSGDECVLGLFRHTATTPFGKRALKERLLMPSADAATIRGRLADVRALYDLEREQCAPIQRALRTIYDLPRLHRKMLCASVGAAELLALQSSYGGAAELMDLLRAVPLFCPNGELIKGLQTIRTSLKAHFDLERAATRDENETLLPAANHPTIGAIETQLKVCVAELQEYLTVLSGNAGDKGLRYEERDKQPYCIRGTKTALTTLKGAALALGPEKGDLTISIQKAGGWVESKWLTRINGTIMGLRAQLEREYLLALPDVCAAFCADTQEIWRPLEVWLALLDVSLGLATEAKARNWCEPHIVEGAQASIDVKGLRHPLIEGLLTRTAYVAHNVNLGSEARGWLVYGMNASGKSSLMKSIGIAIHLAQCGAFVPATTMTISPYRALFTRILNQDNLWAGLSSFAVEMSEMRDILRSADAYTLVLGDELCAGTESVSAKALVAAGIEWLAERGASFVFATHLHGLCDVLPDPASISLKVWHLKVHYDPITQKLVYERHLTAGPGSSLYGLEVARAMNVPIAFLERAHQIRRRLMGAVSAEEAPRSSWNGAVTRRLCEICGSDRVADLEVHHIKERSEGGSNAAHNLMVLCAKCHDVHHADPTNSVASFPLIVTSDGLERTSVQTAPPQTKKRGTWTEEEHASIRETLANYPNLPLRQIVHRLKHLEGIEISEGTLRKFRG